MSEIVQYYSPILTTAECTRESVLGNGHRRTIQFIMCKNAYSLSGLSNNYIVYSALYGKVLTNLARSIAMNDEEVVNRLPLPFIHQIREWVHFFITNDIPDEYKEISMFRPSLEYRIVCENVLRDGAYKAFLPFTSMYRLLKCEDNIAKMMNDITEYIYGAGIYVSCMLPYTRYDTPNEEDNIAKQLLSNPQNDNAKDRV